MKKKVMKKQDQKSYERSFSCSRLSAFPSRFFTERAVADFAENKKHKHAVREMLRHLLLRHEKIKTGGGGESHDCTTLASVAASNALIL